MFVEAIHSRQIRLPVLAFRPRPGHLRQCGEAGEKQVVHILGSIAELRPHARLHPHQQGSGMLRPVFLYRFVVVYILQGIVSEIRQRLKPLRALIADEIHNPGGRHDETMSQFGSFHRRFAILLPA